VEATEESAGGKDAPPWFSAYKGESNSEDQLKTWRIARTLR